MAEAVLSAHIKAFDEFSAAFDKYKQKLREVDQVSKQTSQGTEQLNRSVSNFLQVVGQIGGLYLFQRGLQEILRTGREFEKTFKQTQLIVGDFSDALEKAALAGKKPLFTPTQTIESFRELGAAGLSTNEILKSSPDILNFAVAAMIDTQESAEATIAAVKGFNLSFEDSEKVVDAFSVAMDRTTLKGTDLVRALASIGPVAGGLGKQSLEDTLSMVAALKNMGARADDAATSVRSMLLQLINPTKEASDTMEALGIDIYDSTGKLKTIPNIIAEFERALAPLDERSRQLVMTTVAGSDGIRALAAGLQTGSTKLKDLSTAMAEGHGRAAKYADIMGNTFDGSVRKAAASWEKLKILMFEDFKQGSVGALEAINQLVTGFNNLDEAGRRFIEMLIGSAGFAAAIVITIGAINKLRTAVLGLEAMAGPAGWVVALISLAASAALGYSQSQQQAAAAQQKANEKLAEYNNLIREGVPKEKLESTKEEISKIQELIKQYDRLIAVKKEEGGKDVLPTGGNLAGKTKEFLDAEDGIRKINKELATYGLTVDTARSKVEELNKRVAEATALDYASVVVQTNKAVETKKNADATTALIKEYLALTSTVKNSSDVTNLSAAEQSRLSAVVGELSQKYPSLVTALDEHEKAMLMDNRGMNEQMSVMQALALIESQEARARIEAERAKTIEVIARTKDRLHAILTEQKALRDANAPFASTGLGTPAAKAVLQENPALAAIAKHRKDFESEASSALSKEMQEKQAKFLEAEKVVKIYDDALKNLGSGNLTGGGGPGGSSYTPSGGGGKGSSDDALKEYLENITGDLEAYEMATRRAEEAVTGLGAKQQYLTTLLETGQAGMAAAIELEQVRANTVSSLRQHQERLYEENEAYRAALVELNQKQGELNDLYSQGAVGTDDYKEASSELLQEVDRLTGAVNRNSTAWMQNEKAILDAQQQAISEISSLMREAYQWEEKEVTQERKARYEKEEKELQDRIKALEEASEKEIRLKRKIEAVEEDLADKRREWDEEDKDRELEDLRGQVESSRMVVVENGVRQLQHDIEKEKELRDAELEYKRYQEEKALELRKERLEKELEEEEKKRQEEREGLQEELQAMQTTHGDKLEAVRTYYDAVTQKTILEQDARRILLSEGYANELTDLKEYINNSIEEYARLASAKASGLVSSGGGGGGDSYGPSSDPSDTSANWEGTGYYSGTKSYDTGGPILYDQIAKVHAGEYVLSKRLVDRLGGLPGVEALTRNSQTSGQSDKNSSVSMVVQGASKTENMDVEAKNLVVHANEFHLHVEGVSRSKVDTLAQYGIKK